MKLHFSLQEQIDALTKLGYIIKEEQVIIDESRSNTYKDERSYTNYSVFRNGVRLVDWMPVGTGEVELAFKSEVHRVLLNLLK